LLPELQQERKRESRFYQPLQRLSTERQAIKI